MVSRDGYVSGTKDQGPRCYGLGSGGTELLGPWFLDPGPYPSWLNICASRGITSQAIQNTLQVACDTLYITDNIRIYIYILIYNIYIYKCIHLFIFIYLYIYIMYIYICVLIYFDAV